MPLPPEQEASYSAIIDDILANSNLNTISAKAIRRGLQDKVQYDITPQKTEITQLIMARFDKFNSEHGPGNEPVENTKPASTAVPAVAATTNGVKKSTATSSGAAASTSAPASPKRRSDGDVESELSELEDAAPPKKKVKKETTVEDDAAFAARLQAEENSRAMARSTRGGATKKRTPLKKKEAGKKKKKSANKVNSDDDSDLESGDTKKEVKRTGGFHKPMILSAPLAALIGETQLSRPLTVKKVWEYIKERDLQDPTDKRHICCDDAMRAVFKQDRVHMFTMTKLLNQNLYSPDE